MTPEVRNKLIIDTVLKKEQKLCPGVISLIGIYGSFLTGDIHPLSDLDLLILINDEQGWQLSSTFIQEDQGIGHDIYCTSWEGLQEDALYTHPNIGKLMDSKIVYEADEASLNKLQALRVQVQKILDAPFSLEDYERAEKEFKNAEQCCEEILRSTSKNALDYEEYYPDDVQLNDVFLADMRNKSGWLLYFLENSIALLNKTYFRKGTRRIYDELSSMEKRPENLCELIEAVVSAENTTALKESLKELVEESGKTFKKVKETILAADDKAIQGIEKETNFNVDVLSDDTSSPTDFERPYPEEEKKQPDADALRGTYEEMFSNWRGKMVLSAKTHNRHLAFVSLASFQAMFDDIREEYEGIENIRVFSVYDPTDLKKTQEGFEGLLQEYLQNYEKVGLKPARYKNIEEWAEVYLKN